MGYSRLPGSIFGVGADHDCALVTSGGVVVVVTFPGSGRIPDHKPTSVGAAHRFCGNRGGIAQTAGAMGKVIQFFSVSWSKELVGSSKIRISGSLYTALAIPNLCI